MVKNIGDNKWSVRVYVGMVDGKEKYIQETVVGTRHEAALRESILIQSKKDDRL